MSEGEIEKGKSLEEDQDGAQRVSQRIVDTGLGQAALDFIRPKLKPLGIVDVKVEECTFSLRTGREKSSSVYPDPELSINLPEGTSLYIFLKPQMHEFHPRTHSALKSMTLLLTDDQDEAVKTILEEQARQK